MYVEVMRDNGINYARIHMDHIYIQIRMINCCVRSCKERKDGLTELLYMFIGPKIYCEKTKDTIGVEVRAIQYDHEHEEYKKEERDFRGNIKYSTMINNISDFIPRRICIMKILQDLIAENKDKQIIVLSHKRDLLE